MESMVERVAKALWDAQYPTGTSWDDWERQVAQNPESFDGRDSSRKLARTAIEAMEDGLRSLLNGEHTSVSLSFNEINGPNYQTAKDFLKDNPEDDTDWVSAEERAKAIEENSIWRLQWYPDTPVGFYVVHASSLLALVGALKEEVTA